MTRFFINFRIFTIHQIFFLYFFYVKCTVCYLIETCSKCKFLFGCLTNVFAGSDKGQSMCRFSTKLFGNNSLSFSSLVARIYRKIRCTNVLYSQLSLLIELISQEKLTEINDIILIFELNSSEVRSTLRKSAKTPFSFFVSLFHCKNTCKIIYESVFQKKFLFFIRFIKKN